MAAAIVARAHESAGYGEPGEAAMSEPVVYEPVVTGKAVTDKAMATDEASWTTDKSGAVESAAADADRASAAGTHDSWAAMSALCVSFGREARDHDQSRGE